MEAENQVSKEDLKKKPEIGGSEQFADETNFYVPTDVHKRSSKHSLTVGLISFLLIALSVLVILQFVSRT